MKRLEIKIFKLQTLFLSACFLVLLSCNGKISDKSNEKVTEKVKEEVPEQTKEAVADQAKGIANFNKGVEALDDNNMPLVFKYFMAAAEEGHVDSQFNVATMYEQGIGVANNNKEAFSWYEIAAKNGSSAAQFNLGVCFENGIGTSVNFEKANEWYRKASVQGDGLAVGNLGMLYIRGDGVPVNKVAGIALLIMSTTMDNSPENNAKTNISATSGLTAKMVTEAQALSEDMRNAQNLTPLDAYLETSN
ncbi:tetratricopeptide repeat protein [Formosa sp. PL04]|uniref:tetratricopeptide repeat protein n=1 Tax=Formosa sp. PL04 TaxID=3081755 RepID=UPI0029829908|nr:tetratricopeptide repeat protein [Formosa sp. PL04]MDW5290597.1 tetratricopeptide repeat protein [Formosa sp. PL04]